MKAYTILVWFVFFNLVCGGLGTYFSSTSVGGKDVFGIADKAGVTLLPEENTEIIEKFYALTESIQNTEGFGDALNNTWNIIILLPQMLLMMITFMPNMLNSLQILPPEIISILNIGVVFVTVIAIVQWFSNKWIGWAK